MAAHVLLWRRTIGFGWGALPQSVADVLTCSPCYRVGPVVSAVCFYRAARALSRPQEYLWPLLLVIPFATGYLCSHTSRSPPEPTGLMLVHVYSADLIMALIPFTKIAHCVLAPFSQIVTAVAWKFVPGAGDRVAATFGYADRPSWVPKARLNGGSRSRTAAERRPQRQRR